MGTQLELHIRTAFDTGRKVLDDFIKDGNNLGVLQGMAEDAAACFASGNKILTCGNGGSACEAIHFAEELSGRYRKHRKALPALSLTETAWLTCVGNDYGFENIFSRGVEAYGKPGDMLLAFSTSGNSENVIRAIRYANASGGQTIGLAGYAGGQLAQLADISFIAEIDDMQKIEDVHVVVVHMIMQAVYGALHEKDELTL